MYEEFENEEKEKVEELPKENIDSEDNLSQANQQLDKNQIDSKEVLNRQNNNGPSKNDFPSQEDTPIIKLDLSNSKVKQAVKIFREIDAAKDGFINADKISAHILNKGLLVEMGEVSEFIENTLPKNPSKITKEEYLESLRQNFGVGDFEIDLSQAILPPKKKKSQNFESTEFYKQQLDSEDLEKYQTIEEKNKELKAEISVRKK